MNNPVSLNLQQELSSLAAVIREVSSQNSCTKLQDKYTYQPLLSICCSSLELRFIGCTIRSLSWRLEMQKREGPRPRDLFLECLFGKLLTLSASTLHFILSGT